MDKTVTAEGQYAAKSGESLRDNPYPLTHDFHTAWQIGFIDTLLHMRTELNVMKNAYYKALNEKKELQANLNQLIDELEMANVR